MTATTEHDFLSAEIHPIDMVETLATAAEWEFERIDEDRIAMAVEGAWQFYSLNLDWSGRDDTLRLVCSFEMKAAEDRDDGAFGGIFELLNMINDRIWAGSFVFWPDQRLMAFRYGLTLAGGATATPEQIETMVLNALGHAERFYPAFQLVGWAGKTAREAFGIAIDEAYGTA